MLKRILAVALTVIMLVAIVPMQAVNAAVIPGEFEVVAGQTLRLECNGMSAYNATVLGMSSSGRTVATINRYNGDGELMNIYGVFLTDFDEFFGYCMNGEYFEITVKFGAIRVVWNLTPPELTYGECESYDRYLDININDYYATVGDKNTIQVTWSIPGAYVAAETDKYISANGMSVKGFGSTDESVVTVDSKGNFEAVGEGEAEITAVWRIGRSASDFIRVYTVTKICVAPDYDLKSAYDNYYAANNDRYFNIIADGDKDRSENGFNIIADKTYNTGEDHQMMITFPQDYSGDVTVSKKGYHSYTIKNSYLESYNWITLYPETTENPFIEDVFACSFADDQWQNLKVQMLNIVEGNNTIYQIDMKVYDPEEQIFSAWLQQGSRQLPLNSDYTAQYALGEELTGEGGPVYACVLSIDGNIYKKRVLINVIEPQSNLELDFDEGEGVGGTVSKDVDGIGGQNFSFDLTSFLPIEYEVDEQGNVKGTIGLVVAEGKGTATYYEDIKETISTMDNGGDVSNKSLKNGTKIDDLSKYLEKKGTDVISSTKSVGIDGNVTILGFFEGKRDEVTSELKISNIGAALRVSGKASVESQSLAFAVPYYWKVSLAAEIEARLMASFDDKGDFTINMPPITFTVTIDGNCSVGLKDVGSKGIGVGVGIKSSLKIILPEAGKGIRDSKWILNCSFYNNVSLGIAEYKEDFWVPVDNKQLYPSVEQRSVSNVSYADNTVSSGFEYIDTLNYAYGSSVPQVLKLGTNELVVWTGSESGGVNTDSCLYYGVYDTVSGQWSTTAKVFDDNTPDFNPVLKLLDGTPTLVWQNSSIDSAAESTLEELALSLDICYATFDVTTSSFVNIANVSGANGLHDTNHDVLTVDNVPVVVWSQNSTDDVYNGGAVYKILSAAYKNNVWNIKQRATDIHAVSSLAANEQNVYLKVTYTADTDDDYNTSDDIEVFTAYNGAVTQLTDNDIAETALSYNGKAYWVTNSVLCDADTSYECRLPIDHYVMTENGDGIKAAVFAANYGDGDNLYAIFDDGNGFGDAVSLTRYTGNSISDYSVYFEGDTLVLYSNLLDSTGTYGIVRDEITVKPNVCVEDISYDRYTMTDKGYIVGSVYVANYGMTTAEGFTVKVEGENGDLIYTADIEETLRSGEGKEFEFKCKTGELIGQRVFVSVIGDTAESDLADNKIELDAGVCDISVEEVIAEECKDGVYISAVAVNRGLTDIGKVTFNFYKGNLDGEIIGTATLDELPTDTSKVVSYTTDKLSSGDMVYVSAEQLDGENITQNNYDFTNLPELYIDTSKVITEEVPVGVGDYVDVNLPYTLQFEGEYTRHITKFVPRESGYYSLNFIYDRTYYGDTYWHYFSDLRIYPMGLISDIKNEARYPEGKEHAINVVWLEAGREYTLDMGITDENSFETLFIIKKEAESEGISFTVGDSFTLKEGSYKDLKLEYNPIPSYCEVVYSSSDTSVATIDDNGRVYAKCVGTATITATVKGTDLKAESNVTVTSAYKEYIVKDTQYYTESDIVYCFVPETTGYYKISYTEYVDAYLPDWTPFDNYEYADFLYAYLEKGNEYYFKQAGLSEATLIVEDAEAATALRFDKDEYVLSQYSDFYVEIYADSDTASFDTNSASFSLDDNIARIVSYETVDNYDGTHYCKMRLKAVTVGETRLTVTTPDGVSADCRIVVEPCKVIALDEEVYPESFATTAYRFTPDKTDYYCFELDYYMSVEVLDGSMNSAEKYHDTRYYLEGGKDYYIIVTFDYYDRPMRIVKDPVVLSDISIHTMPDRIEYIYGGDDYMDYSGLELKLSWSDGSYTIWSYDNDSVWFGDLYIDINDYDVTETGKIIISCEGKQTVLNITFKESGVKSIAVVSGSIPDLIENVDGYDVGEYFRYSYHVPSDIKLKITYKDGREVIKGIYDNIDGYYAQHFDTQESAPWGLGTHYITVSYLDASVQVPVKVVKNPVRSVQLNTAPTREYKFGDERYGSVYDGEYAIYSKNLDLEGLSFTVTMTDGSKKTYTSRDFDEYGQLNGKSVEITPYSNYLTEPGNFTLTLTYMGHDISFEVRVVESPVKSITASGEVKLDSKGNYTPDYSALTVKIDHKDGTVKTVKLSDYSIMYDGSVMIDGEYMILSERYDYDNDSYYVGISYLGVVYECRNVKYVDYKTASSVTLDNVTESCKGMKITVKYTDNTTETIVLDEVYSVFDGYDSHGEYYTVYTRVGNKWLKMGNYVGDSQRITVFGISVTVDKEEYQNPFIDVKDTHWFAASVAYCVKKGYASGMTANTFVPNGKLTRAQFLTLLAKLDGVDLTRYDTTDSGFEDVKTSHWFNEVVCWAVEKGYTSGLSETKFGPNANVTRAQVARFFYVYSEKNGISIEGREDLSVFPDASKVANWAKEPLEWAVAAGLISGTAKDGKTYLDPNGTATRAQATVMFKGFDDFRGVNG